MTLAMISAVALFGAFCFLAAWYLLFSNAPRSEDDQGHPD